MGELPHNFEESLQLCLNTDGMVTDVHQVTNVYELSQYLGKGYYPCDDAPLPEGPYVPEPTVTPVPTVVGTPMSLAAVDPAIITGTSLPTVGAHYEVIVALAIAAVVFWITRKFA